MVILSPAKSMHFAGQNGLVPTSRPRFTSQRNMLVNVMRTKSPSQLQKLQKISSSLAHQNADRWVAFGSRANDRGPAALCFTGDVYQGLDAQTLSCAEQTWLQDHVRVLSGLYGLLRPMDMLQPYRLEMGTGLRTDAGDTLVQFWGDTLTRQLKSDMRGAMCLVNLASNEYAKSIDFSALHVPIVQPTFLQESNGKSSFMSYYGKRARGEMARWLAQTQPSSIDAIAKFDAEGYRLVDRSDTKLTFARPKPPPISAKRRPA